MTAIPPGGAFMDSANAFTMATKAEEDTQPIQPVEEGEVGQEKKDSDQIMEDYTVSLSEVGKALSRGENPFVKALDKALPGNGGEDASTTEQAVQALQKQIQELKARILEVQQSTGDEEAKRREIASLRSKLGDLQNQLTQHTQGSGATTLSQGRPLPQAGGSGFMSSGSLT